MTTATPNPLSPRRLACTLVPIRSRVALALLIGLFAAIWPLAVSSVPASAPAQTGRLAATTAVKPTTVKPTTVNQPNAKAAGWFGMRAAAQQVRVGEGAAAVPALEALASSPVADVKAVASFVLARAQAALGDGAAARTAKHRLTPPPHST